MRGLIFRERGEELVLKGVCMKDQEVELKNLGTQAVKSKSQMTM